MGQGTGLVATPVFRLLLGLEEHKALRLQYCFSVLSLGFEADGIEPEGLRPVADRCAALARGALRRTDVITLLSPASLGVLLVDADTSAISGIVQRLTERWTGGATPRVGRVAWVAGAASYPRDGCSGDGLLRSAEQRMSQAASEGGNRLWMA